MARLGRSFPGYPVLKATRRGPLQLVADASLVVSASSPVGLKIDAVTNASLAVKLVDSEKIPYTIPFIVGGANLLGFSFAADSSLALTASSTAAASVAAVATSLMSVTATRPVNATYTTTIAATLVETATLPVVIGKAIFIDSPALAVWAGEGFPFTFPLVFSPITVLATKGLVGDAALAVTDTPSLPTFTRSTFADALLNETATLTDAVLFSALLDSPQSITVSRSGDSTRDCPDDAALAGVVSPFSDVVQGRNAYANIINVTVTNLADATTYLLSDTDTAITASADTDSTRNANFFSYDLLLTADITAEASIVARADAEEIQIVISDSPAADRNANVDADLAVAAAVDSAVNWDAQDLAADLTGIVTAEASEAASLVTDVFGGEIVVGLTAEATRNIFVESDSIEIFGTIQDSDSIRSAVVDVDLVIELEITSSRGTKIEIDSDDLVIAADTGSDLIKGRIVDADLAVIALADSDVIYNQYLDADFAVTADPNAGFSQQQPLDGDSTVEALASTTFIRNQFSDSEDLFANAVVDSAVWFGALGDTDLGITSSRYGEIIRNHNADSSLGVTVDTSGAISFDALLDADLPVTAATDIDFLRDANVDADFAAEANSLILIYNDAETEAQLFTSASSDAEIQRHQYIDADLSVTATPESLEPSRGQLLDSDTLGIVTTDIIPLYNQFLDADVPIHNDSDGAVNFDALLDAKLVASPVSHIDFTKGLFFDSLLGLLAPTEERLRSDLFSNSALHAFGGDAPNANMGRFLYTDQAVTVLTVNMLNFDAVTGALLDIPVSAVSEISELLSSNFFPFYL